MPQEAPREPQKAPGNPRKPQEPFGGPQEAPRELQGVSRGHKRPQESPGGPKSPLLLVYVFALMIICVHVLKTLMKQIAEMACYI